MKTADPRDTIFVELHESYLRQLGYRRRGRKRTLELPSGLLLLVELESSTWNTRDHIDFGINLGVSHPGFTRDPFAVCERPASGDMLVVMSLRRYADPPNQRWSSSAEGDNEAEISKVRKAFSTEGIELLSRMSHFSTLELLCGEFGAGRYAAARSWCLRRLGRLAEAAEVTRGAVSATH
jgi:hypothetical protein